MNDVILVTGPVPTPAEPRRREKATREPSTLGPVHVDAYDAWAGSYNPELLSQAARDALPDHELAPAYWFRLQPQVRERVCGLAVALLHEHPPTAEERHAGPGERLGEVRRLFDVALAGTHQTGDALPGWEATLCAFAARFYVSDPTERLSWHLAQADLVRLGSGPMIELLKDLFRRLDGTRGVVAGLREARKKFDVLLAHLEQRLGGAA